MSYARVLLAFGEVSDLLSCPFGTDTKLIASCTVSILTTTFSTGKKALEFAVEHVQSER